MAILGASSAPTPQDTTVITKTDSLQEVIVTAEKISTECCHHTAVADDASGRDASFSPGYGRRWY